MVIIGIDCFLFFRTELCVYPIQMVPQGLGVILCISYSFRASPISPYAAVGLSSAASPYALASNSVLQFILSVLGTHP